MPTSNETLSKVKNILRKMDQSIDAARNRRLTGETPEPQGPTPAAAPAATPSAYIGGVTNGSPPPNRAKPLARVQPPAPIPQQYQPPRAAG